MGIPGQVRPPLPLTPPRARSRNGVLAGSAPPKYGGGRTSKCRGECGGTVVRPHGPPRPGPRARAREPQGDLLGMRFAGDPRFLRYRSGDPARAVGLCFVRSPWEGRPLTVTRTAPAPPRAPAPAPPRAPAPARKAMLKPPRKIDSTAPNREPEPSGAKRRVRSRPKPEKPAKSPSGRSWRQVLGFT